MRDHDLSRETNCRSNATRSILTTTVRSEYHAIRERLAQTIAQTHCFRLTSNIKHRTSKIPAAFSARQSAVRQRLVAEDYCDPRQIRPGSISPADESDQLPRQDREAPGCASNHAQLEHYRKSREGSSQWIADFWHPALTLFYFSLFTVSFVRPRQ